jgi:two-component system nitrate/nitrite response regulator NarL
VTQHDQLIRIIIAGEHAIFRHGLRRLLERDGFAIIHESEDGAAAGPLVRELQPDILLLGLTHSKRPIIEMLGEIAPATRTILLTDRVDRMEVLSAIDLGARGIVLKDSPPDVLFKSIRSVMAGQYWLGHEPFASVAPNLRRVEAERRQTKAFGLTRRELEIVRAVVAGCSNKEIAARVSISENTVKSHLTHIFNKLGASNRVELALFAAHHRLLDGV